jgi:hypothetical protein
VYESHQLFLKMWPGLLRFSVGDTRLAVKPQTVLPPYDAVMHFLESTEWGSVTQHHLPNGSIEEMREGLEAWRVETRRTNESWVARTYLSKAQN